jgi:phytoene synthase
MTPDQYCQEKAAESGSSFYYSFLFLPRQRRRAITALYAFCREVDDAVDDCHDVSIARVKLAWWRGEVAALYADKASHPVSRALAAALPHFNLPQEHLLEIIDGMEMDLDRVRYQDFKALHLYCYRVASVVGLLAAEIFGYRDRRTLKYAHDLGLAFQLTNIIRDVGEDARRGRIYLPLDELARFGVSEDNILKSRDSDGFKALMEFQADRANATYDRALAELPDCDRKAQRAGLIMAAIYRTVLDEIAEDGFHVLDRHMSLPPLRKLWIAARAWMRT